MSEQANLIYTNGVDSIFFIKATDSTGSYASSSLLATVEGPGKETKGTIVRKVLGDYKEHKLVYGTTGHGDLTINLVDYKIDDPFIVAAFAALATQSLSGKQFYIHVNQKNGTTDTRESWTGSFYDKENFSPSTENTALPKLMFAVTDWKPFAVVA